MKSFERIMKFTTIEKKIKESINKKNNLIKKEINRLFDKPGLINLEDIQPLQLMKYSRNKLNFFYDWAKENKVFIEKTKWDNKKTPMINLIKIKRVFKK